MSLEEDIVALLHERIGFNPESIGSDKVLSAVRAYLKGHSIANPAQFFQGLKHGNQTFQEIIDAVIVPETWFFRDSEPFVLVKRYVSEWVPRAKGQVLRCLSLPCSTGEEPYSIAMSLLDYGLPPERFSVDAMDICPKLLQRAKQGLYGAYSFRSSDLSFRERHFEPSGDKYLLQKTVRDRVQFHHGNLLDPLLMHDGRQYDVIFCRNLLIYFDPPSWKAALKTLNRLLKDTGFLFMGHAEMLDLSSPDFESVRFPGGFAYRKRPPPAAALPAKPVASKSAAAQPRPAAVTRKSAPARAQARISVQQKMAVTAPKGADASPDLQKAGELADTGRLEEAEAKCAEHLARNPGSASGYFLLGLIKEAGGQAAEAEAHYQRALYLDSKHYEAMIHLALVLEGRGDAKGATNLRRRAARARQPT